MLRRLLLYRSHLHFLCSPELIGHALRILTHQARLVILLCAVVLALRVLPICSRDISWVVMGIICYSVRVVCICWGSKVLPRFYRLEHPFTLTHQLVLFHPIRELQSIDLERTRSDGAAGPMHQRTTA